MPTFQISETKPTFIPKSLDFTKFVNELDIVTKNSGTIMSATTPVNPTHPQFVNSFIGVAYAGSPSG